MAVVSFSNIPGLSRLVTLLQTQLGLFSTDAPASGTPMFKTVKKSRPRKRALVAGLRTCQTGKKDLFADAYGNFSRQRPPAQLKVVRQFEADISPSCAGRMTISGSMADVCAELDRMVEREIVSCRN